MVSISLFWDTYRTVQYLNNNESMDISFNAFERINPFNKTKDSQMKKVQNETGERFELKTE